MALFQFSSCGRNRDYAAFTDESDLAGKYMIIGGVSCRSSDVASLEAEFIAEIRAKARFRESMQWKSINNKKIEDYKRMIDWFLSLNREHIVDFHSIIIDQHKLRNKDYNDGDHQVAFNKFMYQSMESHIRRYYKPLSVKCIHGNRDSPFSMDDLRRILNRRSMSQLEMEVYRDVKYANVCDVGMLQLADVLIGCVGYHWNARKNKNTGSAKEHIAQYLASECPADNVSCATNSSKRHFDIWEFRLKGPQD